ncbi:FAD/NAD(P)-binding oxidoreductase [Aminipila sp.]|uniref:FAD/NAD(P)-binding oxidoreductase n=1 Tax=Aminipila sp. TaxID=2060095 RepID=UPI0028970AAC|nr:FAD/NAD(P)-binding oxidoreductase [Aminipila sp.]
MINGIRRTSKGTKLCQIALTEAFTSIRRSSEQRNYITYVKAKAVVLATGCRERGRGNLGILGTRAAGIFTAGTAQALINSKNLMPGKKVVIVGSGDIGLIMARRLTLEGVEVICVIENKILMEV